MRTDGETRRLIVALSNSVNASLKKKSFNSSVFNTSGLWSKVTLQHLTCKLCKSSRHKPQVSIMLGPINLFAQSYGGRYCVRHTDSSRGTRRGIRLGHCATSRKVAGSISNRVTEMFIDLNFLAATWLWGHSASNRNEYQGHRLVDTGGWYVALTLSPSCADCLEIWELQPPGTPRSCRRL